MLATPVITILCTVGVGFYLRFLFALCKDCRPRLFKSFRRLTTAFLQEATAQPIRTSNRANEFPVLETVEVQINSIFQGLRKDRI